MHKLFTKMHLIFAFFSLTRHQIGFFENAIIYLCSLSVRTCSPQTGGRPSYFNKNSIYIYIYIYFFFWWGGLPPLRKLKNTLPNVWFW